MLNIVLFITCVAFDLYASDVIKPKIETERPEKLPPIIVTTPEIYEFGFDIDSNLLSIIFKVLSHQETKYAQHLQKINDNVYLYTTENNEKLVIKLEDPKVQYRTYNEFKRLTRKYRIKHSLAPLTALITIENSSDLEAFIIQKYIYRINPKQIKESYDFIYRSVNRGNRDIIKQIKNVAREAIKIYTLLGLNKPTQNNLPIIYGEKIKLLFVDLKKVIPFYNEVEIANIFFRGTSDYNSIISPISPALIHHILQEE